jgi:serine/threonine-protein kinase HipA
MQIAAQVFGISTATNALILFNDQQPAYITKRFDIMDNGTKYMQEDFAQLTNRTQKTHGETFKYDGSYAEIGLLIKKFVAASMPALEKFFQLILFNYVMSNGDAHLKNFSLIRDGHGEYQLTPAYDLVSTVVHTPKESDTALDLYEDDMKSEYYSTYGHYGRPNFMELARILGIVEKRAERIINSFLNKEKVISEFVESSFLSIEVKKLYMHHFLDKQKRLQP